MYTQTTGSAFGVGKNRMEFQWLLATPTLLSERNKKKKELKREEFFQNLLYKVQGDKLWKFPTLKMDIIFCKLDFVFHSIVCHIAEKKVMNA